jgi:alanine racemase
MDNSKETILEINLKHLKHNFDYLKSKLKPKTKFLGVVKAFAYGSSAISIAQYLEKLGIDYFAVAYTQEGINLRKAGITSPILVLHPQQPNLKFIIDHCLEPSLYSAKILQEFTALARRENLRHYPVHLKFNTGLNRLGFSAEQIDSVMDTITQSSAVIIKSVFSHLAASEDLKEKAFTKGQIKKFNNIGTTILSQLDYKPMLHLCNTSGLLNYPEAHFDMVRCGIGLYGFGNSKSKSKSLIPIASLKTVISQIHSIKKGESIGYNRAYKAPADMRIATLPIGHADGITRIYGNQAGAVRVNHNIAPIVGNVCMDMIMVDVTQIPCTEGDEVIIFDQTFSAENLAENAGTISYELITGISQRIKRKVLNR